MAVNPDSLESHQAWATASGFQFPLCVDEDRTVAAAYGARKLLGGIQRCVFVVDKQGRIIFAAEGAPDTSVILAAIDGASA